jgi:hypothetical protein
MESEKKVECEDHGLRIAAFVCQHLNAINKVGFHEPFDSDPNNIDPEEDLQAWCDECEKIREAEGEWNEKSEAFAKIKLICDKCFFEMKELNITSAGL